jgi:hypothetical protein
MDETYRMLGREREADFDREAVSRRLAAGAARDEGPKPSASRSEEGHARRAHVSARLASLLLAVGPRRRVEPDPVP